MSIASETEGTTIRYTINGEDPNESSPVYSEPLELAAGTTLKAQAFSNIEIRKDSDIASITLVDPVATEISLGTVLADGSVITYDRGAEYGSYALIEGNLVRLDGNVDDESAPGNYWRYLIIDYQDFYRPLKWSNSNFAITTDSDIGYGLQITEDMIELEQNKEGTIIEYVLKRRTDGYKWFIPNGFEFTSTIRTSYAPRLNDERKYWQANVIAVDTAAAYTPGGGGSSGYDRRSENNCRLIRRI